MVLQGKTGPSHMTRKNERANREGKRSREWFCAGVNRRKVAPENGVPSKMTIISQLKASLTAIIRKFKMRTGLQARCRFCYQNRHSIRSTQGPGTSNIFPQPAPHLTSDQQLPLQCVRGLCIALF